MSEDETLRDLTIRTQQMEGHLLHSPEYVAKVAAKLRWWMAALCVAVVLFLFEGVCYLEERPPASPMVLGSIDITSFIAVASCVLIMRTRGYFRRLNEKWLNSDARQTLEALRRKRAEMQSLGESPSRSR